MKNKSTYTLVECSMMVALASVLSLVKLVEMPYGGSITVASMLPILLVAYRHGVRYGVLSGVVYGVLQQLLGLKNLTYFTEWYSIVAVIVLDYLLAFCVIGLGGIFRRRIPSQSTALTLGAVFVCALRYALHTLAGATVWAGLSIPTEAALVYSIGYNATYMLPECIILAVVTYYVSDMIDFSRTTPIRAAGRTAHGTRAFAYSALAGVSLVIGLVIDVCLIFPHLQAEDGSFVLGGLSEVSWWSVGITSVAAIALFSVFFFLLRKLAQEKTNG